MAQNQAYKKSCKVTMKSKCRLNKPEYLSCLLKYKKPLELDERKLHRYVVTNNTDAVEEILGEGVDPNVPDKLMRSPLHLAASQGYKDVVNVLLKYGADPNQKDIIGNTPLHLAACTNNIQIVTLLLNAGTDINSLDQHGRNPLQLAQSKLRLLKKGFGQGAVEGVQLRMQLQYVIDLMLSFLRRKQSNLQELEMMKLMLDESTESQLDDQVSKLLSAIQDISLT